MLFKYATDDNTSADSKQNKLIATLLGAGGAALIYDPYRNGELTGRQTAWHFTKKENVPKILEEGILPGDKVPSKVSKTIALKGEPLVDYDKALSAGYATPVNYLQGKIRYGVDLKDGRRNPIYKRKSMLNYKGVKVNIPLWKRDVIMNPEVAGYKDADEFAKITVYGKPTKSKLAERKDVYNSLANEIAVEGGIPASDIVGSKHYTRNSLNEIKEYIRHNKTKFAKGVGKSATGLGLLGTAAYLLKQKDDNEE